MEVGLLRMGFTLEDIPQRVTWRAVASYFRHAGRGDEIFRIAGPQGAQWSQDEHLTATMVDLLNLLVWMKTKDGAKNRRRPKPVRRPGDVDPVSQFGQPVDLGELKTWLAAMHAKDAAGESNLTMDEVVK